VDNPKHIFAKTIAVRMISFGSRESTKARSAFKVSGVALTRLKVRKTVGYKQVYKKPKKTQKPIFNPSLVTKLKS